MYIYTNQIQLQLQINIGVRNVPRRVRVRFLRKRTQDENAEEKLYTVVEYVPVASFKGLSTETVLED